MCVYDVYGVYDVEREREREYRGVVPKGSMSYKEEDTCHMRRRIHVI